MVVGVALLVVGALLVGWSLFRSSGDDDAAPTSVGVTIDDPTTATSLPPGTTATTGPEGLGVGTGAEVDGRSPLAGFGQVAATITAEDGTVCEVCLLAAEDDDQRARGLMEVTDPELGGYDGMLFVYPGPSDGAFWMRNTPMPLSIAYFDQDGALISTTDMSPCGNSPTCPSYPSDSPFTYALEVPQGRLDEVGVVGDATLQLTGRTCPLADEG